MKQEIIFFIYKRNGKKIIDSRFLWISIKSFWLDIAHLNLSLSLFRTIIFVYLYCISYMYIYVHFDAWKFPSNQNFVKNLRNYMGFKHLELLIWVFTISYQMLKSKFSVDHALDRFILESYKYELNNIKKWW